METNIKIDTLWEFTTYDVWGNARDGFEVNNAFRQGEVTIPTRIHIRNLTVPERIYASASPTDREIRKACGLSSKIVTDDNCSDDTHIELVFRSNHKPYGNLRCISHESLSPIKPKPKEW